MSEQKIHVKANNANAVAAKIVDLLLGVIIDGGFELLQRYPKDLLVHDRAMLEAAAFPGAKIAWMCGHSHTHMYPLGLHPLSNEGVTWVTNMADDDRFFLIKVGHGEQFSLTEMNRKNFEALQHTPIVFKPEGQSVTDFWLTKHGKRIGYISTESTVGKNDRLIVVHLTPVAGITEHEKYVLELWGCNAASKKAGSLLTPRTFQWEPELLVHHEQREFA